MPKLKSNTRPRPIVPETTCYPATGKHYANFAEMDGRWQERPDNGLTVLGVDPGGERVGVCVGHQYQGVTEGVGEVIATTIMSPKEFRGWFRAGIGGFDIVACERWALRPDMAKTLIGSEMETSQLIGWLKFTIEDWNEVYTKRPDMAAYPEIQWVSNPQSVRFGMASVMKYKKIPQVSPGKVSDSHMNDAMAAELHWWYALIQLGLIGGLDIENMPK